jgi:hypothetical protein
MEGFPVLDCGGAFLLKGEFGCEFRMMAGEEKIHHL